MITSRMMFNVAFRIGVIGAVVSLGVLGCATATVTPFRLRGHWEKVEGGDTLESIAARHGANPAEVAELNNLASPSAVSVCGELFVPAPQGSPPGDGASPAKAPVTQSEAATPPAAMKAEGSCALGSCLAWPVDGALVAVFQAGGQSPHDGLDIAAREGAPVLAADKGKVLYSGDGIKGYGNLVILRHASGLVTVYAHAARNLVKEGDEVERGAVIAEVGSTGSARSPHLHFEVRQREEPTDPLRHLPKRTTHGPENR